MHYDKTIDQTERRPANPQDFKTDRAVLFQLWREVETEAVYHPDDGEILRLSPLRYADQAQELKTQNFFQQDLIQWQIDIEADNFEFWD